MQEVARSRRDGAVYCAVEPAGGQLEPRVDQKNFGSRGARGDVRPGHATGHHLGNQCRDFGRIRGHALRHDAVIGGEYRNCGAAKIGLERTRHQPDMNGKLFDAAQRAQRLRLGVDGGPQARFKLAAERR